MHFSPAISCNLIPPLTVGARGRGDAPAVRCGARIRPNASTRSRRAPRRRPTGTTCAIGWALTALFGDSLNETRRRIVKRIPLEKEEPRIVDIDAALVWAIHEELPEHARPGFMTILLSGMRTGEYFACTEASKNARGR